QVTESLTRLADIAAACWASFPITIVHGVDWPTGRRDHYPDLAAVPPRDRQPFKSDGGVERATEAHDYRNGVLTAIEDFVAARGEPLEWVHVPGLGGTAILIPEERLREGSGQLGETVRGFRQSRQVLAHIAAVEAERAVTVGRMAGLADELEEARAGLVTQ